MYLISISTILWLMKTTATDAANLLPLVTVCALSLQMRACFLRIRTPCAAWCSQLCLKVIPVCRSRPPRCSPLWPNNQVSIAPNPAPPQSIRSDQERLEELKRSSPPPGLLLDSDIELAVDHLTRLLLTDEDERVRSAPVALPLTFMNPETSL